MMRLDFINGRVFAGGAWQDGCAVTLSDQGHIAALDTPGHGHADEVVDLAGGMLVPGYIDVQVNGGGGVLFNTEPTVAGIMTMGAAHARYGTTGFLPTLISGSLHMIAAGLDAVDEAISAGIVGCIGTHVEGPVLSIQRKGIHAQERLRPLDDSLIDLLTRPRAGKVLFTIAPEFLDADQARALDDAGVIVSLGHSDADYETTRRAFARGARGVTHLFNAMRGLHHREPGMVGAALENQDAWCGIIIDGHHVHPAALRVALATRPHDRFMLVTDAMPCVGSDAASFILDGREIRVVDGRCVDDAGTLAGAALDMATAVRNAVDMAGLSLETALAMASANPAAFLGLSDQRGAIAPGRLADFVWIDAHLQPRATWIAGQRAA